MKKKKSSNRESSSGSRHASQSLSNGKYQDTSELDAKIQNVLNSKSDNQIYSFQL